MTKSTSDVHASPAGRASSVNGRFLARRPPEEVRFGMGPLDRGGRPLFTATYELRAG